MSGMRIKTTRTLEIASDKDNPQRRERVPLGEVITVPGELGRSLVRRGVAVEWAEEEDKQAKAAVDAIADAAEEQKRLDAEREAAKAEAEREAAKAEAEREAAKAEAEREAAKAEAAKQGVKK